MKTKLAGSLLIAICLIASLPLGLVGGQSVTAQTSLPVVETTETPLTASRLVVPFYTVP